MSSLSFSTLFQIFETKSRCSIGWPGTPIETRLAPNSDPHECWDEKLMHAQLPSDRVSHWNSELTDLTKPTWRSGGPHLCILCTRITGSSHYAWLFFMGAGDRNSGPPLSKPSPQPLNCCYFKTALYWCMDVSQECRCLWKQTDWTRFLQSWRCRWLLNHQCGYRELNSGPLEGRRVLLTLESFLLCPGRKVFMGLDVTTLTPWRECRNLSSPLTKPSSLLMKSRKQCLA